MKDDPRTLLLDLFLRLRRSGAVLGIGELLAALRAADAGWAKGGTEAIKELAKLLWCHSLDESAALDQLWQAVMTQKPLPPPPTVGESGNTGIQSDGKKLRDLQTEDPPPASEVETPPPSSSPQMTPFALRTPVDDIDSRSRSDLEAYWPVSRRSMIYAWQYLRRNVADGPADVLDVDATIERAARQGFYVEPVFRRRTTNKAQLLLLVDQGGSMVPFHRFTRDLVDTACRESSLEKVEVFYFHNVPPATVRRDPHLTDPVSWDQIVGACTADTSVLLVSDAGAARGYRRLDRIRATTECLGQLKQRTTLLAWLNPMPNTRWPSSSAQIIAHLVPMYPMDPDGLSNAIDVLRGQPLVRAR